MKLGESCGKEQTVWIYFQILKIIVYKILVNFVLLKQQKVK